MRKTKLRRDENFDILSGRVTRPKKVKKRILRKDEKINFLSGKIRRPKKGIFGI